MAIVLETSNTVEGQDEVGTIGEVREKPSKEWSSCTPGSAAPA